MAKKSYKFNPETLTYEVVPVPLRLKLYRGVRMILVGFILASLVNLVFSYFFYTPKLYRIYQDNSELVMKYSILQDKIAASTKKLEDIRHRDTYVYRQLFGTDSLSIAGVHAPYPNEKYASLAGEVYSPLMIETWSSVDALARLIYLESKSLDDMQTLAADKEKMSVAIPATWPIDRKAMGMRSIGKFGMRNHPILRRWIHHDGIDLGADKGTPVYATGDATVAQLQTGYGGGYGNNIMLDHGFGYKTRYAHLSKILVTPGQQVKRGEIIGEVGNTGRSSGSHLHYEVILMGKLMDPMNYFRLDMSEEEFESILERAKDTTYEAF